MTLISNDNNNQLKHGEFKITGKRLVLPKIKTDDINKFIIKEEKYYVKTLNKNDLVDAWSRMLFDMTVTSNNNNQSKHGEFKISCKKLGKEGTIENEIIKFKELNQNDLADGWHQILPKRNKRKVIQFFSIYLSHLPEHLWYKVKGIYNEQNNYKLIFDKIYCYNIKPSDSDEQVQELYRHIMSKTPNKQVITKLYNELSEQNVRGWVMTRASKLI